MKLDPTTTFSTIRTEGGILPVELLEALLRGDTSLRHRDADSYHVYGEKLNEAISRAWNRAAGLWERFRTHRNVLGPEATGTAETRDLWLLPLLAELGYGRLQRQEAIEIDGRPYGVSHGWGNLPIHLLGCNVSLDRRSEGIQGAARMSPHAMIQELLNRSDDHLWSFLSNGLRFRLLRDNRTLSRQAYLEFDLEAMMESEAYSDFVLFWLLCHQSRVEGERPETTILEEWSQEAGRRGARALDALRDGVEQALEALGTGFVRHPDNVELRRRLQTGELSAHDFYRELLRLVYRLILLLVAEERDLLHPDAVEAGVRDRYHRFYSLSRLRRIAAEIPGSAHHDLWESHLVVRRMLGTEPDGVAGASLKASSFHSGLGLPFLGGHLFEENATATLDSARLDNRHLLRAVRRLAFGRDRGVLRPVDFRNLGAEELGSVYESLLELHPGISHAERAFHLGSIAGNERKSTGSYYTPTPLIIELLNSTLDPLLDRAERSPNPEEAILDLKICDPACGSGHFLIAAAHRIARRLAAVRSGEEEPTPERTRAALRDVISRSIYGVDINPMAVELCRVALWMESLDPGKPLTFLDHHIKVGNSLIGATPGLIARGIPDGAYAALEGDHRGYANQYRKDNRRERDQKKRSLFSISSFHTGDLAGTAAELLRADDSTIIGLRRKEQLYIDIVRSAAGVRLLPDLWTAAFFWRKDESTREQGLDVPTTEDIWKVLHNNHHVDHRRAAEAARLAEHNRFFHWHLEFPDVFTPHPVATIDEDDLLGWEGGFDCVVGNPPWEQIQFKEKEFFASRVPEIAGAATAAKRKRAITELEVSDPELYNDYLEGKRGIDIEGVFVRESGLYPLCGIGRLNTYQLFAELVLRVAREESRAGIVLPSGIATDHTTRYYFQYIVNSNRLVSLFDFENRKKLFPAVDSRQKFCLLTLAGASGRTTPEAEFVFFAHETEDLRDPERRFRLTSDDIALINPNTRTCPIFRTRRDAEITRGIYRRVPVLMKETENGVINPWGAKFSQGLFNMASDSHLFHTREDLEKKGFQLEGNHFVKREERFLPLYEAKMFHQFDHRFAGFMNNEKGVLAIQDVEGHEKERAEMVIFSRYYVNSKNVAERLDNSMETVTFYSQTAKQPNSQTAKQPNSQTAKQPNSQTAKQPNSQTAKQPNSLLLVRLKARSTDARTVVSGLVSGNGVGHTASVVRPKHGI